MALKILGGQKYTQLGH